MESMRGADFIRRVRRLGRRKNVAVRIENKRGKGSHLTLYYGKAHTVVKDRSKELGSGLFRAMCAQLGIDPRDL